MTTSSNAGSTVTGSRSSTAGWSTSATCVTIHRLVERTRIEIRRPTNPALNYDPEDPDWLVVESSDGTPLRSEVAFPLGSPHNPLSFEGVLDKFMDNAGFADGDEVSARAMEALRRWDQAADVNTLLDDFEEVRDGKRER